MKTENISAVNVTAIKITTAFWDTFSATNIFASGDISLDLAFVFYIRLVIH